MRPHKVAKYNWSLFGTLKWGTNEVLNILVPLHVVLELDKHTLTLPCSVEVWLGFWKSEHDETWKLAMGQQDGPLQANGWKDINVRMIM